MSIYSPLQKQGKYSSSRKVFFTLMIFKAFKEYITINNNEWYEHNEAAEPSKYRAQVALCILLLLLST